ncbi:MAG: NAD(P)/FAD-dependent oxidoreductase [Clostridia bacterium]|nr:NAD(P)/FAD-dependent oxidoreductase [Clostridia bacterium]
MSEIAVIGGGASGLTAAISAAELGADVTVYEKNDRVGKKLLATGNGRCNLSNINAGIENYHGNDTSFMKPALNTFWYDETIDFFENLGLLTKADDDGRVYPYSDRSSSVVDILRLSLDKSGVNVVCGFEVSSIIKRKNVFEIVSYDGEHRFADRIIISAGGRAAPGLGGGSSGYEILRSFGHHITELRPSIVQLKTDTEPITGLKGVKCRAMVKMPGKSAVGELLFTDYGISGPPVFLLSSYYNNADEKKLSIDFFYDYEEGSLFRLLMKKAAGTDAPENLFTGILHKNIGRAILKQSGCPQLNNSGLKKICRTAKDFKLTVTGTMSWNNAQVTAGGVRTEEIDPVSFMSKKCSGLYVTGEILDIDGDCGGYNLQWAWSSGHIAGTHAALN